MDKNVFKAVYVDMDLCYGPKGSEPLREAIFDLCGQEADIYRGDGFLFVGCPQWGKNIAVFDGDAIALSGENELVVLKPRQRRPK